MAWRRAGDKPSPEKNAASVHWRIYAALWGVVLYNAVEGLPLIATIQREMHHSWLCFYQTRSAWSMDQGSNKNHSPAYNFAPTVTKFCVMWEGLSFPHDTKFGNCRCEIVDNRAFPSWSLIHVLRWSGLIKAEPGITHHHFCHHWEDSGTLDGRSHGVFLWGLSGRPVLTDPGCSHANTPALGAALLGAKIPPKNQQPRFYESRQLNIIEIFMWNWQLGALAKLYYFTFKRPMSWHIEVITKWLLFCKHCSNLFLWMKIVPKSHWQ